MENEQPAECDSCHYETPALTYYEPPLTDREPLWLCRLCAGSLAGRATEHPHHFEDGGATLQAICYVGNAILDAIRDSRR